MQLTITGTQVEIIGSNIVGFAQNNLVNTISATVDTPSEYVNFTLKIYMNEPEQYNAIPFIREMVRNAINRWITEEEAIKILNEDELNE